MSVAFNVFLDIWKNILKDRITLKVSKNKKDYLDTNVCLERFLEAFNEVFMVVISRWWNIDNVSWFSLPFFLWILKISEVVQRNLFLYNALFLFVSVTSIKQTTTHFSGYVILSIQQISLRKTFWYWFIVKQQIQWTKILKGFLYVFRIYERSCNSLGRTKGRAMLRIS